MAPDIVGRSVRAAVRCGIALSLTIMGIPGCLPADETPPPIPLNRPDPFARGAQYDVFQPAVPLVNRFADPGACILSAGHDGASLPAGFPTTVIGVEVGQTIADSSECLTDANGTQYHPYAFLGHHVMMITLCAGWAPPCQSQMVDIQFLYEQAFQDGFAPVVGMVHGDTFPSTPDPAFLNSWESTYYLAFPLLADPNAVLGQYARPADAGLVPLNIIVNRDGVVVYNQVGAFQLNAVATVIGAALNEPASLTYP